MDPSGLLRLRSPRLGFLDLGRLLLLLPSLWPLCGAFNLDADSPAEYSGPEGSYFGFAVDFFVPSASSRMFLLVGAPKANTTQPGIVEGGQVLKCDWSSSRGCQPIVFDATGLSLECTAQPTEESFGSLSGQLELSLVALSVLR